jgi:hypothetical protein
MYFSLSIRYKTTIQDLSSFLPKDMVQYFIDNGFLENILPPKEIITDYSHIHGPPFPTSSHALKAEPRFMSNAIKNTSDMDHKNDSVVRPGHDAIA